MDHLTFELKTATITNPHLLTIGLVNEKAKVAFAVTQKEDLTFVLRLNKHRSVMGDTSETIIPELKKMGMLYLNNKVKEFSEEKKAWEEFLKYVKPFSSEFYTKNGINILEKVVSIVETRISHLENMTLQKIFNDRYVYLGFDATIVETIGLPGFVPEERDIVFKCYLTYCGTRKTVTFYGSPDITKFINLLKDKSVDIRLER